ANVRRAVTSNFFAVVVPDGLAVIIADRFTMISTDVLSMVQPYRGILIQPHREGAESSNCHFLGGSDVDHLVDSDAMRAGQYNSDALIQGHRARPVLRD